jgi:hypothetical protein
MVDRHFSAGHFAGLLDLYGPVIERWPAELKPAALAYLSRHPEARQQLDAAARVNGYLCEIMEPVPLSAGAIGRLSDGLARRREKSFTWSFSLPQLAAVAILVIAAFSGGVWTGGNTGQINNDVIELAFLDTGFISDEADTEFDMVEFEEL